MINQSIQKVKQIKIIDMENSFKQFLEFLTDKNSKQLGQNNKIPIEINADNNSDSNNQISIANSIVVQEQSIQEIVKILPIEIQKDESLVQNKIGELSNIANSEPFISDISEKIGLPKENESKAEFVERGLKIIKERLMKQLNDK